MGDDDLKLDPVFVSQIMLITLEKEKWECRQGLQKGGSNGDYEVQENLPGFRSPSRKQVKIFNKLMFLEFLFCQKDEIRAGFKALWCVHPHRVINDEKNG